MASPTSEIAPLTTEELKRFVYILNLLQEQYKRDLSQIEKALGRLPDSGRQPRHKIAPGTSFGRYTRGINEYLDDQANKVVSTEPPETSRPSADAGGKKKTDYSTEVWIRDFLRDLETCFVDKIESEKAGQIVLNGIEMVSRVFSIHFWYWDAVDKQLPIGLAVEGTLYIYNDWMDARLEFDRPDGNKAIYKGPINLRRVRESKNRTYYLTLKETDNGREKPGNEADELMLVLTTRPRQLILVGSFSGAVAGYPAMGRAMLIEKTSVDSTVEKTTSTDQHAASIVETILSNQTEQPDGLSDGVPLTDQTEQPTDSVEGTALANVPVGDSQFSDELAAFARSYVSYQTTYFGETFFDSPEKVPGFSLWLSAKKLFEQPLHGYFYKTGLDSQDVAIDPHLAHFTLSISTSTGDTKSCPAVARYDNGSLPTINEGYISIEQESEFKPVVYRGGFVYMPKYHRFRYEIQFVKATVRDSDWYFGTLMGLNRSGKQLLLGRFALRQSPLDTKYLEPERLGELFKQDQVLADFLMETNQQIPSETLPLYNKLNWPHIPRVGQAEPFKSVLAGEYNCYALVRKRLKSKAGYTYLIAGYPTKIFPDGRVMMKYEKQQGEDGAFYDILYYGRAFHNKEVGRLFLYFDKRQEGKSQEPLHLSMYFAIQPSSPITRAFGTSNRFVHTEEAPEGRMEVLVRMKEGDTYEKSAYTEYNPLESTRMQSLFEKEPYLGPFLSGRINRMILPNSGLKANSDKPYLPRQEPFRQLHIKAALFEIAHGGTKQANINQSLKLVGESFLHGFGTVKGDDTYLKNELKKPYIQSAVSKWSAANQQQLTTELYRILKFNWTVDQLGELT